MQYLVGIGFDYETMNHLRELQTCGLLCSQEGFLPLKEDSVLEQPEQFQYDSHRLAYVIHGEVTHVDGQVHSSGSRL